MDNSGRGRSQSREKDQSRPAGKSPDRDRRHRDRRSASPRRPRSRSPHAKRDASPRRRQKDKGRSRSRSRSRSASPKRSHKRHRRSRSRSRSRSSSANSDRDRRSRRKDKHRHRSRSRSRSRDRHRKHKRKSDKKDKKDKKNKTASSTAQWGKYGIINESDLYTKEAEFRAYLVEELMINPETLSKELTKKHFMKFVEDFNTATLPHEKYYALEPYERRMASVRNGEMVPQGDLGVYNPTADMAEHSKKHKRQVVESETYLSKDQLQELRQVQRDRIAIGKMKVLGQDIGSKLGVRMDGNQFE